MSAQHTPRRAFTAPPRQGRCKQDITLRGDKSVAQCMRRAVVCGLCKQHAAIAKATGGAA